MQNNSGYKPFDIGVLVKINPPEEKRTKGGLILTSQVDAVSIEAVQKGELVECGHLAFEGVDNAPKVGDTIFFAKYSGQFLYPHMTDDEENYRVMDYTDIRLIKEKK